MCGKCGFQCVEKIQLTVSHFEYVKVDFGLDWILLFNLRLKQEPTLTFLLPLEILSVFKINNKIKRSIYCAEKHFLSNKKKDHIICSLSKIMENKCQTSSLKTF